MFAAVNYPPSCSAMFVTPLFLDHSADLRFFLLVCQKKVKQERTKKSLSGHEVDPSHQNPEGRIIWSEVDHILGSKISFAEKAATNNLPSYRKFSSA